MASKKRKPARAKRERLDATAPCSAGAPAAHAPINHHAILQSVGEAAYEWQIDTDTLTWGANATQVLGIRDTSLIASGRAYANLLDPGNAQTRFDAVMNSKTEDDGNGVPYQVEYCLRAAPRSEKYWIEDTGRWFAGPDGRPARAAWRDPLHQRAPCARTGARLPVAIRRTDRRDQPLASLQAFSKSTLEEAIRSRQSCGFLLVAIDNLARVNEAYGYDIADEVISAVAKRLRTKMRTEDCLGRFSGNKFGLILRNCSPEEIPVAADRLLAGCATMW